MVILLNGPLGIGKSTLAEALTESLQGCAMLDGDHVAAVHPPPADEVDYLHTLLALLAAHHRRAGYRHCVINHLWRTGAELDDLRRRLVQDDPAADVRCFLLTLPLAQNLQRIRRRQAARALDERDFEQQTVRAERALLYARPDGNLGEPFDVEGAPDVLAARLRQRLGLP